MVAAQTAKARAMGSGVTVVGASPLTAVAWARTTARAIGLGAALAEPLTTTASSTMLRAMVEGRVLAAPLAVAAGVTVAGVAATGAMASEIQPRAAEVTAVTVVAL